MDLASVPEIGPAFAGKLTQAGVENAESLAAWEDLAGLSARSGVDQGRLESFRDAARERVELVLAEAGVADPADLAGADTGEVAARTGLAQEAIARYQAAARLHVQRAMEAAGYHDAEALAAMEDVDEAAARSGVPARHVERYRAIARAELEAPLKEAGIEDPADLAEADLDALSERPGISRAGLERYQQAARAHVQQTMEAAGYADAASIAGIESLEDAVMKTGISPRHLARYRDVARGELAAQAPPVEEPAPAAPEAPDRSTWRVVLVEGAPVARVVAGSGVHHAVPLVTAGPADDPDELLDRAGGDAVLLKPALDAVPAQVAGARYAALDLYKERRLESGEVEEVRVRVAEIREVPEPKKKGGIGRLFRRGS